MDGQRGVERGGRSAEECRRAALIVWVPVILSQWLTWTSSCRAVGTSEDQVLGSGCARAAYSGTFRTHVTTICFVVPETVLPHYGSCSSL